MRKRDYRVTLYLDRDEKEMLRHNAKACGMDDNSYLRQLLTGHEPRQAPDDRFWDAMAEISEFTDKIDALAMKAEKPEDAIVIMKEANRWRAFWNEIEMHFLRPKKVDTLKIVRDATAGSE